MALASAGAFSLVSLPYRQAKVVPPAADNIGLRDTGKAGSRTSHLSAKQQCNDSDYDRIAAAHVPLRVIQV